jgi:hypothetical protein
MASHFAFATRLLRRFAGAVDESKVEILPPVKSASDGRGEPDWDLNGSVEDRANAFMSLFLNAGPKDMRSSRMNDFRGQ